MVFTNHETRNTNHGLFLACFDRRVVRNAGQPIPPRDDRSPATAEQGWHTLAVWKAQVCAQVVFLNERER